ncbi:unnamed protein product [Schistosoma mattheei]|uniref:Uncharacterized protein n=1 Tax=Schistosoma mattheei TaxID=31246 RepID=A0A3P7XZI2_9TREM|nr:unnamed protein product [Schistosoma mattheei]
MSHLYHLQTMMLLLYRDHNHILRNDAEWKRPARI